MTTSTAERLLDSLQGRLNRLEHALRGTAAPDDTEATDIPEFTAYDDSLLNRLQRLEKKFAALSAKSPATADLLTLYEKHGHLLAEPMASGDPNAMTTADKTTIILASSSTFEAAQARLSSLDGVKLEDASALVPLATMRKEIAAAQAIQEAQEALVAVLQERTANVLAKWYQYSILDQGRQWAEWEGRLMTVERTVKRKEVAKTKDGL